MKYFKRSQRSHLGFRQCSKSNMDMYYARSIDLAGNLVYKMNLTNAFKELLKLTRWEI